MSIHANKIVLVTGGSSGIGAKIAETFTREGAIAVIVGRNETTLNIVANKCEKIGHRPHIVIGDVSKEEDDRRIIDETIEKFSKLDVLVNNAAFAGYTTGVQYDDCMEFYKKCMATNLEGPIRLTHHAIKYLLQSKGNVVNISSIASVKPIGINFPYSISKAALDHFTRCIAYELGSQGVRVNSIMSGPVRTNIYNVVGDEERVNRVYENLRLKSALLRVSQPEEIADLVSFLASEKAKGMTGSVILHDNGLNLKGSFK